MTNGPDAVPASSQTGPAKLNRAVLALASKHTSTAASTGAGRSSTPSLSGAGGDSGGSVGTTGSGSGSSGSGTGSGPSISTPSAPNVTLPGSNGSGDTQQTINNVNGAVNNLLGGVNNTLNGLLGQ